MGIEIQFKVNDVINSIINIDTNCKQSSMKFQIVDQVRNINIIKLNHTS